MPILTKLVNNNGDTSLTLCELTVTTRHSSLPGGTHLEFNADGRLINKSLCARQIGTTVLVQRLFHSLPVRLKQFHQHIHKEYTKMMHILQGYCIVLNNVKVVCSNTTSKGRKSVVLSTTGSAEPIENFCSIFGSKQRKSLLKIQPVLPSPEEIEECGLSKVPIELMKSFHLDGHISSCKHGSGRSSPDRQYIYVNKRPCDWTKLTKIINDVYHQFNRNQYPTLILNIKTSQDAVDVNLTPDKRSVMVHQEKVILMIVQCSLKSLFQADSCNYDTSTPIPISIDNNDSTNAHKIDYKKGEQTSEPVSPLVSDKPNCSSLSRFCSKYAVSPLQGKSSPKQTTLFSTNGFTRTVVKQKSVQEKDRLEAKRNCSLLDAQSINCSKNTDVAYEVTQNISNEANGIEDDELENGIISEIGLMDSKTKDSVNDNDKSNAILVESDDVIISSCSPQSTELCESNEVAMKTDSSITLSENDVLIDEDNVDGIADNSSVSNTQCSLPCDEDAPIAEPPRKQLHITKDSNRLLAKSITMSVDIDSIKQNSQKGSQVRESTESTTSQQDLYLAKISPDQNNDAEKELKRHITKEMFKEMEIIGQFNKGFIITRLNNELFIIDQHATDEKYNFETLQLNEKLSGQKLIQPRNLELTASNEDILINNLKIFQHNGFEFNIEEDGQIGRRINLLSLPTSKNWTFSVDDIEELIFQLSDAPGTMCRPSRVRQMFASRACRKSVMIGTVLTQSQMKKIVEHMSTLEHPWNCPHGRPTMRHLLSLKRI